MNCREYGGTSLPAKQRIPRDPRQVSPLTLQSWGRKLTLAQKRRSTDLHLYPSPANATPQYGDIGGDIDGFRQ